METVAERKTDAGAEVEGAFSVLRERSVSGARWTLLLGAFSLPLSYLTSVLLGRVGPDALGTYSLIILFQAGCMTFLVPGSDQALVRYLPRLRRDERGALLAAYGRIPAILLPASVVLLLVYPRPVQVLLFGSETGLAARIVPAVVILAPVVVAFKLFSAVLQSGMDIKGMAIATKTAPLLVFLGAVGLILFGPDGSALNHLPLVILGIVVLANLASVAVAGIRSSPLLRAWRGGRGPIPPGFRSFTLFSFSGAVIAFAFGNLDLIMVSNRLGVRDVGLYKAALASAEFVRWVPIVLLQTIFPLFCNLLPQGDEEQVRRAYRRLVRYMSVLVGGIGLAMVCFSLPVLRLFGGEFTASRESLTVLSAVFTLSAISTINGALVVAAGRVGRALLNGTIAVTVQVLLSLWLVPELGAVGAAIGKAGHLVCLLALDAWLAYSTLKVCVPPRVIGLVAADFALMGLAWGFAPGALWQVGALGVALVLVYVAVVWALKLVHREDISLVVRGALGRSATTPDLPA